MTKVEERAKERSECGREVHREDSPLRNQKTVAGQAQARQDMKVDLLVSVTRRAAAEKQEL